MSIAKGDMILHPIRMKIIQALVSGNRMTAQGLQARLPEVPQATLYRHLKKLLDAGLLIVVEEIPNRGTIEKVYMLAEKGADITAEELQHVSADDHLSLFMNYSASIIGAYGRYVQQDNIDLMKDGVTFRQATLYLTEEENLEMLRSIADIVRKAMQNEPNEQRRRRLLSIVDIPDV